MTELFQYTTFVASETEGGSSFLVAPNTGVMIWTVIAFLITLMILKKYAFPLINEALDKRQKEIEDSVAEARRTRAEADAVLAEYQERLKEARVQAEDIVARAKRAAEQSEHEALELAHQTRDGMLAQTRSDIAAETRRALQQIREEVAALTVAATEKVTRKVLTKEDQQRLVAEALQTIDLDALTQGREN